jgi:hypothetical protein
MDRATAPVHNPNQHNALPYGFDNPDAPVLDAPRLTTHGLWVVIGRTFRAGRITGWEQFPSINKANDYYRYVTGNTAPPPCYDVICVGELSIEPAPEPWTTAHKPEPTPDAPPRTHLLPEYVDGEWVVYTRSASRRIVGAAPFVRLDDAIAHYKFLTETD